MVRRIGELLVQSKLIDEEQVTEALEIQKRCKKRLGEILIELSYISSKDLIRMLCEQAAIPFIELRPEMLDGKLIKTFPEKFLFKNNIIPIYETEDELHVATSDPPNRAVAIKLLKYTNKEVVLSGADSKQIKQLLDRYFLIEQTEQVFLNTKET